MPPKRARRTRKSVDSAEASNESRGVDGTQDAESRVAAEQEALDLWASAASGASSDADDASGKGDEEDQ